MIFDWIDPLANPEWDRLISAQPEATIFHTSAWARVIHKTYGHIPFYLHASETEQTVALVPLFAVNSWLTGRRGVCLPFSDVCDPIVAPMTDAEEVLSVVRKKMASQRWKYIEWRGCALAGRNAAPSETFVGHTLDLGCDVESLFGRFDSAVRRAIRKAERSGLQVHVESTLESVKQFYGLHIRTRQRLGVPPQSFALFQSIWEEVIRPGMGFVVVAQQEDRAVAAAVYFRHGAKGLYKYGASDERLQDSRANNLVMWEGIKKLLRDGASSLHFGRSSTHQSGLLRYKRGWGAREETIPYFRLNSKECVDARQSRERTGDLQNRIIRKLPRFVNRLAGTLLYPHLD